MQPEYDLRLRSMMKALADTIIPAIDSANRAAAEQAHIVLGSLELLRRQIDYAHCLELSDVRDMAGLIRAVIRETDLGSPSARRPIRAPFTPAETPAPCFDRFRRSGPRRSDLRVMAGRGSHALLVALVPLVTLVPC
jgi:hypothetical protein